MSLWIKQVACAFVYAFQFIDTCPFSNCLFHHKTGEVTYDTCASFKVVVSTDISQNCQFQWCIQVMLPDFRNIQNSCLSWQCMQVSRRSKDEHYDAKKSKMTGSHLNRVDFKMWTKLKKASWKFFKWWWFDDSMIRWFDEAEMNITMPKSQRWQDDT